MTDWLDGLVSLLYPHHCSACGQVLLRGEKVLCTFCLYRMPRTRFDNLADNPLARHFWGKVNIQGASAYYYFNRGQHVQRLIHNLKYRRKKEAGVFVGNLFGHELLQGNRLPDIDEIVPVPLHPSRLRSRGYNQSWYFALGLSQALQLPVNNEVLVRVHKSGSQTKSHRFERWQNVHDVFSLGFKTPAAGRHYLLVDDVITTGSTAAACAETLLAVEGARVSIASIAFVHHA